MPNEIIRFNSKIALKAHFQQQVSTSVLPGQKTGNKIKNGLSGVTRLTRNGAYNISVASVRSTGAIVGFVRGFIAGVTK